MGIEIADLLARLAWGEYSNESGIRNGLIPQGGSKTIGMSSVIDCS